MRAFALIVCLLASAQAFAQLFGPSARKTLDFESGNFDGWLLKRLPDPKDAKILISPVRSGKYAVAVTLRPGARYKDGWKSELSDDFHAPFDRVMWYRVSHYLPQDFTPAGGNACMLAQWHNESGPGLPGFWPLLAHRYEDGDLAIISGYSRVKVPTKTTDVREREIFRLSPFKKSRWHDLVYRVIWSKGGTGTVQAWHNGRFLGTYEGLMGYPNDAAGPYFKTGVYCERSPRKPLMAIFDAYRRGTKKEHVLLPDEKLEEVRAR